MAKTFTHDKKLTHVTSRFGRYHERRDVPTFGHGPHRNFLLR
jgi:hypothetical protein